MITLELTKDEFEMLKGIVRSTYRNEMAWLRDRDMLPRSWIEALDGLEDKLWPIEKDERNP